MVINKETQSQLKSELKALDDLRAERGTLTAQKRGQRFEKWLADLLHSKDRDQNLHPRLSFRPKGEEIDGSFICDSRIFLLEAKWFNRPLPASAVYAFKGKVDGKLAGTVGVFVSMSGYSEVVVDALRIGKDLNVVLFDRGDIEAAIDDGFKNVLRVKMRAAAELGEIKYPYIRDQQRKQRLRVIVLTQDSTDETLLYRLLERISPTERLMEYEIRAAGSGDALPDTIEGLLTGTKGHILVLVHDEELAVDNPSDQQSLQDLLINDTSGRLSRITLDQGVRDWLFEPDSSVRSSDLEARAQNVDLERLRGVSTFEALLDGLRR